jgi:hypothetical protein
MYCCLLGLHFRPEGGGRTFLRNVCELIEDHTASHLTRYGSSKKLTFPEEKLERVKIIFCKRKSLKRLISVYELWANINLNVLMGLVTSKLKKLEYSYISQT